MNVLLRGFRFATYAMLMFVFVYTLCDPNDEYYYNECRKRYTTILLLS